MYMDRLDIADALREALGLVNGANEGVDEIEGIQSPTPGLIEITVQHYGETGEGTRKILLVVTGESDEQEAQALDRLSDPA